MPVGHGVDDGRAGAGAADEAAAVVTWLAVHRPQGSQTDEGLLGPPGQRDQGHDPTLHAPPERATAPQCCTQRTVTVKGDVTPKVRQHYYWGSDEWIAAFNRRNAVEALFGNLKSPTTENVRRGWTNVMGLVKTTLLLTCRSSPPTSDSCADGPTALVTPPTP